MRAHRHLLFYSAIVVVAQIAYSSGYHGIGMALMGIGVCNAALRLDALDPSQP